jgi:ABC-type transport system involved in cytochrome bd biosynthesis fused ATPase/permease subunit
VLRDFSFELTKGDFAGLKGVSGAGKTSFINILLGFLEPSNGEIYINNEKAGKDKRRAYWSSLSYARQQPFFMHESILYNILLSAPEKQEKLHELVRITGVDKMIGDKMNKMEVMLAEKAKNISGGQKQRVILARTLYKDADLYILDEPFNELDKASSASLLAHLQKMAASGKMILMVTHDDHGLSFCNKVISLDEN